MNDVTLSAENLKIFEDFYRRRLAEAGGVRDDAEELAVARDILQAVVNDGLTPTSDGGASYVRRSARDWSDPTTVQAAQATIAGGSEAGRQDKKKKGHAAGIPTSGPARSKEMLQGLVMLAAVIALAGWFLWPILFGRTDQVKGKSKQATVDLSTDAQAAPDDSAPGRSTETALPSTPVPTLQTEMMADIIDAGGVKTGLVAPRTLEIKGVSFIIQPVLARAGDWPRPEDARAASWVYGTVVNYVLGLEATPENKQLLASLSPGDEFLLRLSTGPTYRFAYADAVRISPQASEIFAQTRPGLILVLLGDQDQATRIVIRAIYLSGQGGNDGGVTPVKRIALGDWVAVGESLGLTCLDYEPKVLPDTPPGYIHLGVTFSLENRLKDALVTTAFAHQIKSGELTYPAIALSNAGQAGVTQLTRGYPNLPAALSSGQVFTTTAVYVVPELALKEEFTWEFTADPAGQVIQVALPPYEGVLEPAVSIQSAELRAGVLVIRLALQAPALHPLELASTDLRLEGGTLAPVGNLFPWRLAAGRQAEFTLLLSPQTSPVTIGLLEHGFEINWKGGEE